MIGAISTRIHKPMPERSELERLLTFRDGRLYWLPRGRKDFRSDRAMKSWNSRYAGAVAGGIMSNGYRLISIGNSKYLEHRIIFHMLVRDLHPEECIDHIDLDISNNSIGNLRACTHAQNLMNQPGRRPLGSLPKHVFWSKREQKFKVGFRANGKRHHVGTFGTAAEADEAARAARAVLHGEFANDQRSRS